MIFRQKGKAMRNSFKQLIIFTGYQCVSIWLSALANSIAVVTRRDVQFTILHRVTKLVTLATELVKATQTSRNNGINSRDFTDTKSYL